MFNMLKQAREMQKRMSQAQKRVEKAEVTAAAEGGKVTVVMSGKLQVKSITIDPAFLASGNVRSVQDLVASTVNAAITKAQEMMAEEMKQVTGGLKLPGLSDLF
jgi:DNA-binding YbaB/EbfC family protein